MGKTQRDPLVRVLTAICLLLGSSCDSGKAESPVIGGPPPPFLNGVLSADADVPIKILWLFQTSDCLDCQDVTYSVRGILREWPGSVAFIPVHVGTEEDSRRVSDFLLAERLPGAHERVSPREHARSQASLWHLPVLLVVAQDRVVWFSTKEEMSHLEVSLEATVPLIIEAMEEGNAEPLVPGV